MVKNINKIKINIKLQILSDGKTEKRKKAAGTTRHHQNQVMKRVYLLWRCGMVK